MTNDARISTALPSHPKTKKIIRRLGEAGAWNLVCLILWAAANRSDGDLTGMSVEDIELAIDYRGQPGALVQALCEVGFLDGDEGGYFIHDWAEHNPWVNGADMRSAKARWNAVKRHHGATEADRQVPEWAAVRNAGGNHEDTDSNASSIPSSNARSTKVALLQTKRSNAPSPSPSPSEKKSPNGDLLQSADGETEDPVCMIVLEAYHRHLPACEQVSVIGPKRTKRLQFVDKFARQVCRKQGWSYNRADFWDSFFGECESDPWMRGEVPHKDNPRWKQNLWVLIAEDRFAAIMDRAIARLKSEESEVAA